MIQEMIQEKEEQKEFRNIYFNFDFMASKPSIP